MTQNNEKVTLRKEISEMENLAEKFIRHNKFHILKDSYGLDAISDLTNFVLDYDRKVAVLNYLEGGTKDD